MSDAAASRKWDRAILPWICLDLPEFAFNLLYFALIPLQIRPGSHWGRTYQLTKCAPHTGTSHTSGTITSSVSWDVRPPILPWSAPFSAAPTWRLLEKRKRPTRARWTASFIVSLIWSAEGRRSARTSASCWFRRGWLSLSRRSLWYYYYAVFYIYILYSVANACACKLTTLERAVYIYTSILQRTSI